MSTSPPEQPNYRPQGPPPGQPGPHPGQQPYPGQPGATAFASPPPKKRRVWLWVLISILAFFLILLVACGAILSSATKSAGPAGTGVSSSSTDEPAADPTDEPTQSPTKQAQPKTAQIGDTVKAGDWQFKVTDFDCGHKSVGSEYLNKKAQGQFCFLKLTAKNNGDDSATVDGNGQKLTDDDGKTYSSDTEAALYEDPDNTLFLKAVNPGNTAKGLIVFDIPKKTEVTEVTLTGFGIFDGEAKVSLK